MNRVGAHGNKEEGPKAKRKKESDMIDGVRNGED